MPEQHPDIPDFGPFEEPPEIQKEETLTELVNKKLALDLLVSAANKHAKELSSQAFEVGNQIIAMMKKEEIEAHKTIYGQYSLQIKPRAKYVPYIEQVVDEETGELLEEVEMDGFHAFVNWIAKTESYEFIQKRVNDKPVNDMLLDKGILPPGIDTYMQDSLHRTYNQSNKTDLETNAAAIVAGAKPQTKE